MNENANRRALTGRDVMLVVSGVILALVVVFAWRLWSGHGDTAGPATETPKQESTADEVKLPPEVVSKAQIEMVAVHSEPLVDRLQLTGTVQANQERQQQVTPLVSGRVERVDVVLGDRVQAGARLLTLVSPQIADLQGSLRAAEAKLAEATATLTRTQRLLDLGAGAGKDLIAAQAEHRTAEAQVAQLRHSLQALGATPDRSSENATTSNIVIRAPITGTVIDRSVNPGAWIEAGKPLVTLANLGNVWVIVSVPEARLATVRVGSSTEIFVPSISTTLQGRVSYIDAELDQQTRTARARVEVPNPHSELKIGTFVNVTVKGAAKQSATELTVPDSAVQQIGERKVVFVATQEAGRFEVKDVNVGDEVDGQRIVLAGLAAGDRVVTRGAFTIKSQLLKGQFGEEEELGPGKKEKE